MEPFQTLNAVAVPFDEANISTDAIIPARFLKVRRGKGYGRFLFHDRRFAADGTEVPAFVLNQPPYRTAGVLVADENFGCGSAREGAVYALGDFGIRCIIAPSFADIFFNSCFPNGLLPVRLSADVCTRLRGALGHAPGARMAIDLPGQTVEGPDGERWPFEIDADRKQGLLDGLDEVDRTMDDVQVIAAFEAGSALGIPGLVPRG